MVLTDRDEIYLKYERVHSGCRFIYGDRVCGLVLLISDHVPIPGKVFCPEGPVVSFTIDPDIPYHLKLQKSLVKRLGYCYVRSNKVNTSVYSLLQLLNKSDLIKLLFSNNKYLREWGKTTIVGSLSNV